MDNKRDDKKQQGKKNNADRQYRRNWQIKNEYSRVIEEGKQPRVMKTRDAIAYAESLKLDLVEIGYDKNARCSNCKILDFSKFIYDQKKRDKLAKKQMRANQVEVKNVQFSLTIDDADKERQIEKAKEFLNEGDKVKLVLRLKSRREIANKEYALNAMRNICMKFAGFAVPDTQVSMSGREISCVIRKA